jgi:hypothetical protein
MHYQDIVAQVMQEQLWVPRGQARWRNNSLYGTLIKACQAGDRRFERVDDGPVFRAREPMVNRRTG